MAIRLKNGTGKILNGCTVSFAVEQFSSTSLSKSDTTLEFATQVNATSPKTGTWVSRAVYSPTITSATYANLNGASSANRTTKTVVLNNLNIGPNDDLWLRWTVSSTPLYLNLQGDSRSEKCPFLSTTLPYCSQCDMSL